jgi:hypothetical protein
LPDYPWTPTRESGPVQQPSGDYHRTAGNGIGGAAWQAKSIAGRPVILPQSQVMDSSMQSILRRAFIILAGKTGLMGLNPEYDAQ